MYLSEIRFLTYRAPGAERDRAGMVEDGLIFALPEATRLRNLLGPGFAERLHAAGERARRIAADVVPLSNVRLRAPIPDPPTVRDFYSFEQHAQRTRRPGAPKLDPDWYELPVFYFSNPYAVNGPGDDIAVPAGSRELDFELEVAAVVGEGGSDLSPDKAELHVAGFTIMNDWSARDIQRREMKFNLGPVKGKDFATTFGPCFVTPDELEPFRKSRAYDLAMVARVNGREYSRASLADIHWSFGDMLAHASRGTRIEPGDLIGSGTCGTGCILELSMTHGEQDYPWLEPGDVVELEVERIGVLRNRVVAGRR